MPDTISAVPLHQGEARRAVLATASFADPAILSRAAWDAVRIWGPAHTEDTQYLRVYVGYLRRKLGPAASLLRTEAGIGYCFGEPL